MTDGIRLPVVPIPGLTPDGLGNYLASLGLLHLLAQKWPSVCIAWRDDVLNVVGGPSKLTEICDQLACIAEKKEWTPYGRSWLSVQKKKSTKAKSGKDLALWVAQAKEGELELFNAHAVPAATVSFNPVLGSGGNAGRRDFSKGWGKAVEALRKSSTKSRSALEALLLGEPTTWLLEELNAASWFSDANKLYNSGQKPFRVGLLSPWAMALACEGLAYLAGGASRRLGAQSRGIGAFPFVTRAAAPEAAGEAGRDLGEIWVPIWARPMTSPEVQTLFARGRAEVQGRGTLTPGEFATAVLRRGVDAGISEFRRFVLGRTTSANTFESRFEGIFGLPIPVPDSAASAPIEQLLGLVGRLPRDRKVGKRWRFEGLRGPVEAALLRLAAMPEDPELARGVLDAAVTALDRVDRNRSYREARVSWQPLPIEWLPALFRDEEPTAEAGLALALVSGFPRSRPFSLYRFGVEWKYDHFEHPDRAPPRWVWRPGMLLRALTAVLLRRTLDCEAEQKKRRNGEEPVRFLMPASSRHVSRWLDGAIDENLLARWLSRLALFDWDWRFVPRQVSELARPDAVRPEASASLCLFGLLQPLFDRQPVKLYGTNSEYDLLNSESGARTPAAARKLASLIRIGQLDTAVRFAISRYAMARAPVARINTPWCVSDPERLLASILFQIPHWERGYLVQRWLRPQRKIGETVNV